MEKYLIKDYERIDELGINDLKIIQNTRYFCFGFDSVLLANFVKDRSNGNNIIDLCSGSGVIPILMSAKVKAKQFFCVEMQNEMFDLLSRNIDLNNLKDVIYPIKEDVRNFKGIRDILIKKTGKDTADIITVNPPYKKVGTGIKNENPVKHVARYEEFCSLDDVFNTSSKLLNDKGKLYLVHKPNRLSDLLSVSRKYNLEPKKIRFVYPKINSKPSIVLLQYIKNAGSEIEVLPPLIEYNEDGRYTEEIYSIYGWKGNKKYEQQ